MTNSGALRNDDREYTPGAARTRLLASYLLLVGFPAAAVAFILARNFGALGAAGSATARATSTAPAPGNLSFIVMVLVTLSAARITGAAARRLGQPRVVGEMLAGILLGPSVLGWLWPAAAVTLFAPAALPYLNALGQLGLVLFMFVVGTSVDLGELRHRRHAAILISHVSVAAPLFLGVALAAGMYGRVSSPGVPFPVFALFLGAAMSITAFPVLAQMLEERGMRRSPAGTLATACAAVDDVTGWSLLGLVVLMARGSAAPIPIWLGLPCAVGCAVILLYAVRPRLAQLMRADEDDSGAALTVSILLALGGAAITEAAGLHLGFGAFFAGTIIPRRPQLIDRIVPKIETVTSILLLPLFFAYTGLRTRMGLLHGAELWLWTGAILLVAMGGKLGGCMLAARLSGIPWRESVTLGVLMNTRGLMELVALNIGLDVGLISPAVFSMMVLMAMVTTIMAGPLLSLCDTRAASAAAPQQTAVLWK